MYRVHQIRNSLKFVSYKDRKKLAADLKPIYQAITEEEAVEALESFEAKWGKNYPQIAKSWYNNWDNLMIFLQYPEAIRRIIYTTNAIESLNNQLRKVTYLSLSLHHHVFLKIYDNCYTITQI
jgi:putative transposase